jgi:hypothetical protein
MAPRKTYLRKFRDDATGSASSSRAPSASRTPIPADDSDDEFIEQDFQRIEDLLNQKLLSLQQTVEANVDKSIDKTGHRDRKQHDIIALNRARIQESSSIPEIIASLQLPRTEVSTTSRELLLAQLYKLIVSKPIIIVNEENIGTVNYIDEENVQKLINLFTNHEYRTETEFLYLFRSIIALIASNIEDFGGFITSDFLELIATLIQEPATSTITNSNKANLVIGYTSITLILQDGSGYFGVDDKIKWLIDLAEGYSKSAHLLKDQLASGDREYSTKIEDKDMDKVLINEAQQKVDDEALVCVYILQGIASLLTLLPKGEYLNEICEDLMIKLVTLVDDEVNEISKATARTIAVIYELYDYDINSDEETDGDNSEFNSNAPYYEQEYLFSIFDRLAKLSSKRISKKEKKEVHSVFRSVGNTLEAYADRESREAIQKKTEEGIEILKSIMDSTYIKLSKYRSLPINSWHLYARLRQLKWCFSFGLHSQLVCNDSIKDILNEQDDLLSAYDIEDSKLNDPAYSNLVGEAFDKLNTSKEKKRAAKIKKDRANKLNEQMGAIDLSN